MELLLLTASGCRDNLDESKIFLIEKRHIPLKYTHLFSILVAFPAATYLLQAVREVWAGGAAILVTAAALPSHKVVDSKKVTAEHYG